MPGTREVLRTLTAPDRQQVVQENVIMDPVTWFSIPARDTDRATAFYSKVFGWKVQPRTQENDAIYDYNVVVNSASDDNFTPERTSRINGCIVKKATGITSPVILVEVDDLDESVRKVVAAGGTVVSERVPMKSLNGDFILIKDPEGNMVEVFESTG